MRRPSDQAGPTSTRWPRLSSSVRVSSGTRLFDHQHAGPRGARPERDREMLGVPGRRVDRLLEIEARHGRGAGRTAWSTGPAGRRRASPRRGRVRRRAAPASATAWCAAACRARARPDGLPRARTSGRGCRGRSRVPGSPARIAASRPTASPRPCCRRDRRCRNARCRRAPRRAGRRSARRPPMAATASGCPRRAAGNFTTAPKPSTEPGRSSSEAVWRDELAPLGVVGIRQQRLHRHVLELGIAVELLPIRKASFAHSTTGG